VFQPIRQKAFPEQTERQRLLYCGTCKTIGKEFGSFSRFLLHSDLTFLGEILVSLSSEQTNLWDKSYQSYNCLNTPKDPTNIPSVLKITSILNLFLWKIKLEDAVLDEGKWIHKKLTQFFQKEMESSKILADSMGIHTKTIEDQWINQQEREKVLGQPIEYYTEPTEIIFSSVFFESASKLGISSPSHLALLGRNYGKLVYLLDAWEDYEKDFVSNRFNAIRASNQNPNHSLSIQDNQYWREQILGLGRSFLKDLKSLGISSLDYNFFSKRLDTNLKNRLKIPLCACQTSCKSPKLSWSQKWNYGRDKVLLLTNSKNKFLQWTLQAILPILYMIIPYSTWADDTSGSDTCSSCIGCICMLYCCNKIFQSSSLGENSGKGCCCCQCCSDCCVGCTAGCCIGEACCG
jgi:hypothetical protein